MAVFSPGPWKAALLAAATSAAPGFLGCGGTGNPSIHDVQTHYNAARCARLRTCFDPATKCPDVASDDSHESICSQDRWDRCYADIATAQCISTPALDIVIPASCKGC